MSNKNKTTIIKTIPAYDVLQQQHHEGNWKLVGMEHPWIFTQERQRVLGGTQIGVYETKPINSDHELRIATLSEMMSEVALLGFTKDVKAGDSKTTPLLMKSWMALQTLRAMAQPFVSQKTKKITGSEVFTEDADMGQVTAVCNYHGKEIVFASRSFLSNGQKLDDISIKNWLNELLNLHRHRISSIRIFVSRHKESFAHANITSGVTRMLSVPTATGAQAGIEYAIQSSLRPDVLVSELLFG